MVNLFQRSGHDSREEESRDGEEQGQYRDADERTRLLPRDNEHYLSPDDPAVR